MIGTVVGLVAGLLFAPKSGKEIREDIAKKAKVPMDTVKNTVKETTQKISEIKSRYASCCDSNNEKNKCCTKEQNEEE